VQFNLNGNLRYLSSGGVSLAANVSGIADGGALNHRSLIEKQMFNMSTEDKLKTVSPTFGNTVLPAVFHSVEDKNITLTPLNLIGNFGVFDLDPCGLQWHKTANKIISLPDDGLIEQWNGRVWLNPPYSNPKPFIKKLAEHGNGIALVLNSTDTDWFQEYGLKKANGMYLLKGRPKFTRMDMSPVSIMRGVVLFAYGEQNCQALKNCQLNGYYVGLQNGR